MTDYLSGEVESGVGRGANFIALPIYSNIFKKYIEKEPFHGTLNVKLDEDTASLINSKFSQGDVYENLEYEGKKYGGIVVIDLTIRTKQGDISGVGVRPHLTSHESDVLEIVTFQYLRSTCNLQDGDIINFKLKN